jgi:hypothetical protein
VTELSGKRKRIETGRKEKEERKGEERKEKKDHSISLYISFLLTRRVNIS